jgi:hypothetical protein
VHQASYSSQVRAQPLPCSGARPGVVYDLHAAHADSGATDGAAFPFVPPQWRPFNEGVPQIPGTFPVRPPLEAGDASSAPGDDVGQRLASLLRPRTLPRAHQMCAC